MFTYMGFFLVFDDLIFAYQDCSRGKQGNRTATCASGVKETRTDAWAVGDNGGLARRYMLRKMGEDH